MFANWITRSGVTVMLVCLLASGSALAERGERGGEGGGEGRGHSGGGESASRSFSGGGQSFRGGEGSSRSFSRGGEGASRSFGSENRGSQSFRSFSRRSSDDDSRSYRGSQFRGSEEGAQIRSYRGDGGRDAIRTDRSEDRSGDNSQRGFSSDRSQFQGRNEYQARRPSENQVRNFLDMQNDGNRSGDDRNAFRGRYSSRESGDRNWSDQDRGDFRNRSDFRDRFAGDDDGRGRGRDDRGARDYDRWKDGVWLGERGKGRDDRDWSGRWRDGDRFRTSHYIRDRWFRDRWDRDDYPFYVGWWGRHRGGWDFWDNYARRHNRPYYWWAWTAAPRLASWVSYGWPQYYYWDYGRGEYIYYDDGVVYVNGQWYQPGPVFYERTVELVNQAPELTPEEAAEKEWLPLGVFAVTRDGQTEPSYMVQLAVTQDGVIGGTAFDPQNNEPFPVDGIVEKETQRAVWSFKNNRDQRILMETSIFNLTQPEATGLVQYGPDEIRVIQLVRLEQPEGGPGTTATDGELPTPSVR